MGKYNRASTTRKLQKLTAELPTAKEAAKNIVTAINVKPSQSKIVKTVDMKKQLKEVVAKMPVAKTIVVNTATGNPKPVIGIDPALPGAEMTVVTFQVGKTPEELKAMNVYQKLQLARSIVGSMQIKKSGANDEAGFNYFELADFVPMLNNLGEKMGIMPQFSMTNEMATLKVVNTDKPKEVAEFSIPTADLVMADAEGKVAEGIQVLGGKTTYLRRYLYQIAFEISVKDTVDSRSKTPAKPIDDLDQADIDAIKATGDIDSLAQLCKDIKARKGFNKNVALLKHYTTKKEELGL